MLPAESENHALTDGRTEGQMDTRTQFFEGYNIIPHTF